ncbi:UDP pyrophosphate phosphatase [Rhodococcus ruber]|nr:UDP pyrophosphate phosphatase [Rhodococcus ruber]
MTGESMTWLQALVLGLVQGLTEFLPISSSGHLRIVSEIFFGTDAGASFTAVTQLGTEAAVLVFFGKDIVRIVAAWFRGLAHREHRSDLDYRMGWYVIVGTIPVGVLGFLFKDQIRTGARNLWLIATMLIVFALVIAAAERYGRKTRKLDELTLRDGIVMGSAQALALIPGVSRSGGTISAGLFLGLTREAAARYSFLLAIPAVVASGLFSLPDAFEPAGEGLSASGAQLFVATAVAFAVGYASIAWLLKFVVDHSMYWFVGYRIALGTLVLALLATGTISAT